MPPFRRLDTSFFHGVAAFSAYAIAPFIQSPVSLVAAGLICIYAGWCCHASILSFMGGVIVAVVSWMIVAILSSHEVGFGAFIMAPVALLAILPIALIGYAIGKILFAVVHSRDKSDGEKAGVRSDI